MFKRIYPTQENKTTLRHRQFGLRSRHCSRISSVSQRLHYEETHIFGATDGSKTSEGNGAGVFGPRTSTRNPWGEVFYHLPCGNSRDRKVGSVQP